MTSPPPPRATLGRRLALSLGSVAIVLALAELALRAAGATPARFHRPRALENADKSRVVDAYPSNPHGTFDLDLRAPAVRAALARDGVPELDRAARRTPYAVSLTINPDRCRNPPVGPRNGRTARVLVIGDSFTEGQGVREHATFARVMERALRQQRGRDVEVVNCGRRGVDFPRMYERFEELVPRYEPDVVLYAMVLNDAAQSPAFRARQEYLNDWIMDRRRWLSDDDPGVAPWWRSRLWDWASDRYEAIAVSRATTQWYRDMYAAPNAAGWAATQDYLRRMDAAMRARGGAFAVALLPLLVGIEGQYPFEAQAREIARACRAAGIPFDDTLAAVRGRPSASLWVHAVDMHPNEQAHALFGARMAPLVERALDAAAAR